MPIFDDEIYYVKLTQITEVEYYNTTKYVMFKCNWANIKKNRGYKEDEYGLTLVNFNNLIYMGERITDEPHV